MLERKRDEVMEVIQTSQLEGITENSKSDPQFIDEQTKIMTHCERVKQHLEL